MKDFKRCYFCGKSIRLVEGTFWVHADDDYDPFSSVHAPRPADPKEVADERPL